MVDYADEIATDKNFIGNVVIKINGTYFAIRPPDSGLVVQAPFSRCIQDLALNPTQIDIRKVSTTIASYSFALLDLGGIISALIAGDAAGLMRQDVEIWLGRSGTNMPFSSYFKLPVTKITKISHSGSVYSFITTEQTERVDRPIYSLKSRLLVDILAATSTLRMADSILDFPSSGFLKIEDEFVSYTGKNNTTKEFTGVVRGEFGSTPAAHDANTSCSHAERVQDNPINIILKILISDGGGGSYDTLQSGCGLTPSLIDITEIEALRDVNFPDSEFELTIYNVDSALKYIEDELLTPNNLRFNYSVNSKLSLVILDRAAFVDEENIIDHDTITKPPQWSVDSSKVVNSIEVSWSYNEGTAQFEMRDVYDDDDSISAYGKQNPLIFEFKGIQDDLDGQAIVDDFAQRMLQRLSTPKPEITFNTQVDKSLLNIGDKTRVESSMIPANDGTLSFASEVEIVSRSINFKNGDVQFKLAFTSFTGIRSCFIAPSDLIATVHALDDVEVGAGRGTYWQVGWKCRLWDDDAGAYTADPVNEIASITDDRITFVDAWASLSGNKRLKFPDYDDATSGQKRYCFVSDDGNVFPDGKSTYQVTY